MYILIYWIENGHIHIYVCVCCAVMTVISLCAYKRVLLPYITSFLSKIVTAITDWLVLTYGRSGGRKVKVICRTRFAPKKNVSLSLLAGWSEAILGRDPRFPLEERIRLRRQSRQRLHYHTKGAQVWLFIYPSIFYYKLYTYVYVYICLSICF